MSDFSPRIIKKTTNRSIILEFIWDYIYKIIDNTYWIIWMSNTVLYTQPSHLICTTMWDGSCCYSNVIDQDIIPLVWGMVMWFSKKKSAIYICYKISGKKSWPWCLHSFLKKYINLF